MGGKKENAMASVVRFLGVRFGEETPWGAVYLHDDEARIPALMRSFFGHVEEQCAHDRRFDDPGYLAAKFVVWAAAKYNFGDGAPLDFCSVGLVPLDATGDDTYSVLCIKRDARPKVRKVAAGEKRRAKAA